MQENEKKRIMIFAGRSGKKFAQRMCRYLNVDMGQSSVIQFSEGNLFVKIDENVRGKEAFIVQPIAMQPNDEFVEILFWLDAFKRASIKSITAIIPFFSYAKGDKKDEPRVSIRARVCAECIELAGADRVIMMDLHSPQIQGFFKKTVDHLHAMPVLCEYVKKLNLPDLTVVSPDAGFTKNARNFANYLNTPLAIADKMRQFHDERAEIMELIGDVTNRNVLVVDDFSISGGTLIEIAKVLKKRGAKRIIACLSHFLLNEKAVKRIDESLIELVIGTDSVNNPFIQESPKFVEISVAPLFAEAVDRITQKASVSKLFEKVPNEVINAATSYTK